MNIEERKLDKERKSFITALGGKMPNKEIFRSLPVISLLGSNLLIAVFAIVENQSVLNILWAYWLQSVVIGFFNFFKILSLKKFTVDGMKMNSQPLTESKAAKIGVGIFFLVHYGIFHGVYAGFLYAFGSMGIISKEGIDFTFIMITGLVFFVNYTGEFIFSYRRDQATVLSLPKIMFAPYKRIIPMHLTLILSGFVIVGGAMSLVNSNFIILIIFIGLKTFVDLITHS